VQKGKQKVSVLGYGLTVIQFVNVFQLFSPFIHAIVVGDEIGSVNGTISRVNVDFPGLDGSYNAKELIYWFVIFLQTYREAPILGWFQVDVSHPWECRVRID
jgi:hypothetical protein